jgi:hypothetical protein
VSASSGGGPLRAALGGLRLARPGRTVVALAARPGLWVVAARMVLLSAAPGWWHRWPATPAPPLDYVAFRSETMLGGGGSGRLAPDEVVAYLRWCRRMRAFGG